MTAWLSARSERIEVATDLIQTSINRSTMQSLRRAGITCLFALISSACTPGLPIQTQQSLDALPNSMTVPLPTEKVQSALLRGLQTAPEHDDPFYRKFGFHSGNYLVMNSSLYTADDPVYFHAEERSHAVFGSQFFADPKNADDLYVDSMGMDVVSSYYHTVNGPLAYNATFAISLQSRGVDNTLISVRSFNSSVANGREFNLHVMGTVPASVPVAPSRAEEYRLLVYVAHVLGIEMPTLDSEVKRLTGPTH